MLFGPRDDHADTFAVSENEFFDLKRHRADSVKGDHGSREIFRESLDQLPLSARGNIPELLRNTVVVDRVLKPVIEALERLSEGDRHIRRDGLRPRSFCVRHPHGSN